MTAPIVISLIISVVAAYLLGSVNFAIIVTKFVAKKDIRDFGSGNAGMTNVLRTFGKAPAALTLLGDFSKGLIAVLIAKFLFTVVAKQPDNFVGEYAAAFSALLGHVYPIFYKFKGGKGVLVSSGALVILAPIPFLGSLMVFLILVSITKIVSVGSIASSVSFPIFLLLVRLYQNAQHIGIEVWLASIIALLIIFMHRENIVRLIHGEENKFSPKKKE